MSLPKQNEPKIIKEWLATGTTIVIFWILANFHEIDKNYQQLPMFAFNIDKSKNINFSSMSAWDYMLSKWLGKNWTNKVTELFFLLILQFTHENSLQLTTAF